MKKPKSFDIICPNYMDKYRECKNSEDKKCHKYNLCWEDLKEENPDANHLFDHFIFF